MLVYSVIMFASAILFLALGIAIYRGNTKLIHEYHQSHIYAGLLAVIVLILISGLVSKAKKKA